MEVREKKAIQMKFAIALHRKLNENKEALQDAHPKSYKLITSLRKLEAASGISFPIIQKIATGKKNPGLTTVVAIAESLDMSLSDFFALYDDVDDKEVNRKLKEAGL